MRWRASDLRDAARGRFHRLARPVNRRSRRRASARSDPARAEQAARSARFALYGLGPAWRGSRWLAHTRTAATTPGQQVTTLVLLAHGDPNAADGVAVGVTTSLPPARTEESWVEATWLPDDDGRRMVERATNRPPQEIRRRRQDILVHGHHLPFQLLVLGDGHWVAEATIEGAVVTVEAVRFPVGRLELARVTDLRPYLQGARAFHA